MLQDIAPHIFNNQYYQLSPTLNDYVLYFQDHSLLVKEDQKGISFPCFSNWNTDFTKTSQTALYLFSIDERKYFLIEKISFLPEGYEMKPVFLIRQDYPLYNAFAALTGYGLYNWYKKHLYCGQCGTEMIHSSKERMKECPKCGNMEYPKISPAVIIGVINGDKILLSKYANREYTRYALLAGFAESGETIEQTVEREVMEEVGLKIKNLQYYKSQPWGLSESLLLGFFVELDGDDTLHIDQEELAEASWFTRENLPPPQSVGSLTNEMIEIFRKGLI